MIGVQLLEEGVGVGPELVPLQRPVVIGIGAGEPAVQRIRILRPAPEGLAHRADEDIDAAADRRFLAGLGGGAGGQEGA